jgi:hypothetical protein
MDGTFLWACPDGRQKGVQYCSIFVTKESTEYRLIVETDVHFRHITRVFIRVMTYF